MTVTRPSCLLPRVLESCTVGPVSSGDAILSAGSSWLRPQYSRCTGAGALAPPLAAGGGRLRFQRPQWRHCSGGLSTCFTEPPATASAATTGTPAHAGLQRGGPASGSRCPSRPLGLSLCNFHHVVGAVVLGGRLWATRGSVPTGLCPGSVVTSRTAPCRAAVVTSCVFSICHSWCCSRLCGVK